MLAEKRTTVMHGSIDLRRLEVWERPGVVLERADALRTGQAVTFTIDTDPRALISRLEQLRPSCFSFDARHVGEGHWSLRVTRLECAPSTPIAAAFARNRALSRLSADARRALELEITQIHARKGDVLCNEDEVRDWLGIVLDGTVGVFSGAGDRERLLLHRDAYDLLGEIQLLDGGRTIGRTVVLSRTACVAKIPFTTTRALMEKDPEFLRDLALLAAQDARGLAKALGEQVHQPIIARVAIALLPYAAPEQGLHPSLPPLAAMTQTQIAAAAGTVKEVAARAIADLERLGAIRRERGHIAFLDRTKLLGVIGR